MKRFFFGCVVLFFGFTLTAAYKVPVEPLQQFDVADYGAVSNDGLSDHAAINAAIDAACAVGGGIIGVEPGAIYHIGETSPANRFYRSVQIDCSNIYFRTQPGGELARLRPLDPDGQYLIVVGSGQSGDTTPPANTSQLDNIKITDLILEDDDPEAHSSAIEESHGIGVYWVKNIEIDVQCESIGDECIDLKGDLDSGTQKYVENFVIHDSISNNTPSMPGGGAFVSLMNARNGVIENNRCNGAARATTVNSNWLSRTCVALWSSEAGIPVDNITIRRNDITGYYTDAIGFFPSTDHIYNVTIEQNTIDLGWSGGMSIVQTGGSNCNFDLKILDNRIYGPGVGTFNKTVSPSLCTRNAQIRGNTLDGTVYDGTELGTSTASTMERTGAAWVTNEWVGFYIECTSGTCADQKFPIIGNDGDTLTISGTWSGGTPDGVTFRLMYHTSVLVNGATATSGTTNTITDTGAGWTVNAYANLYVNIESGTCSVQTKRIASNTSDTITLEGTTVWDSACTPDATSVFDVQSQVNELAGAGIIINGNTLANAVINDNPAIRNFPGAGIDMPIAGAIVMGNHIYNVGMAGTDGIRSYYAAANTGHFVFSGNFIELDSAGIDVIDTASWSSATSIRFSDNVLIGTANGNCINGAVTSVFANYLSGCQYGINTNSANPVISGNIILPTNRGMYISNSARPVISGNQIIEAGATAIDLAGTTDYAVMIGNRSYHSSTTREIECSTLNGGVGANDVCLGNWDGNGVKDTLSTLGVKITSGTTPPATCTVGEMWQDTDATAADQLLSCTATDTWTAQ